MKSRFDENKLFIGAYILQRYARTERHVKELADCGIDFVTFADSDEKMLDLFYKYGIGAIVSDVLPRWWGGDGKSGNMSEENTLSFYEKAAEKFKAHPAIWGIDLGDEPSALDFEMFGKAVRREEELFPGLLPFINLYPNYALAASNTEEEKTSQLGTSSYEKYIEKYVRCVPTDYICYDFYMYAINEKMAYDNLTVVSEACRKNSRKLWIVLQVNSSDKNVWISENRLRMQAYSAMAFGAVNIMWACWTGGWWHNQVLDENGEKTEQYEKLKKVNGEIRFLGDDFMKYSCVKTHFVGFGGERKNSVEKLDTPAFHGISASGKKLIVGEMADVSGKSAVFISAADDPFDKAHAEYDVTFRAGTKSVRVNDGRSVKEIYPDASGIYRVRIGSCEGVLIMAE